MNEDSVRDHWNKRKLTNKHITVFPEGEERDKSPEKIFEMIRAKTFHNMGKEKDIPDPWGAESQVSDKPKEEDTETTLIKLNKILKKIKSNKGKSTRVAL